MKTIAIANQKGGVGKTTSIRIIFGYRPDSHGAEDYLVLCRAAKDEGSNLYPLLFKTIVKKAGGKLNKDSPLDSLAILWTISWEVKDRINVWSALLGKN